LAASTAACEAGCVTEESDLDDCADVEDTGRRAATCTFGFFGAEADCFGAATSMLGSDCTLPPAELVPALSCASAALSSERSSSADLEKTAALDVRIMI
jgi:hypothetical protein